MNTFKRFFNSNNSTLDLFHSMTDQDDGFNFGKYFELSYKHRMYGFIICSAIGLVLSFLGILCMFFMSLIGFGITYSLGNIFMILSTLFLFGPMKQIKSLFSSIHRAASTIIFVFAILMTLVAAFAWHSVGLCILFLIIQAAAFIWYIITSIPGGQTMCCSCVKSVTNV